MLMRLKPFLIKRQYVQAVRARFEAGSYHSPNLSTPDTAITENLR